jgi:hypothetical protein
VGGGIVPWLAMAVEAPFSAKTPNRLAAAINKPSSTMLLVLLADMLHLLCITPL